MRGGTTVATLFLAVTAAAVRTAAGAPPEGVEKTVREALTAVLAEPDPAARKALVSKCVAAVGDVPTPEILAALKKGPIYPSGRFPKARKRGKKTEALTTVKDTVVGYSFEHGGRTYRYAVDVPKDYDPDKAVGLLLDPGHGTGAGKSDKEKADFLPMWRGFTEETGHKDWLVARTEIIEQLGPDAAKPLPEDEIARVFDAFFRDLFSRFHVDPDRVYVSGLSQTGFWAWYLGAFRADRFAGIAPMSAVTWEVKAFPGNLSALPVFVLHGDADKVCPVAQPREMVETLKRVGVDVRYKEVAGAGHEIAVWSNLPEGLTWLGGKPRVRYPARVVKAVRNTTGPWAYWIRIDAIEDEGATKAGPPPTARVEGEIEGQTVRVTSEHVKALTVCLSSERFDLAKPVEVVWNRKTEHKGVVVPSLKTLLSIAGEKCDASALYEASVALK
jgi:poly(3-hydroxybutyrate) depolymerase